MKRVKAVALSLTIILALAFVFHPTQALADNGPGGGPQGTTNTRPPSPPPPPPPLWWWLLSAIF